MLKYDMPIAKIITSILELGKKSLGCPIEIEFAVNIKKDAINDFCLLQIKPMIQTGFSEREESNIDSSKIFCKSQITHESKCYYCFLLEIAPKNEKKYDQNQCKFRVGNIQERLDRLEITSKNH